MKSLACYRKDYELTEWPRLWIYSSSPRDAGIWLLSFQQGVHATLPTSNHAILHYHIPFHLGPTAVLAPCDNYCCVSILSRLYCFHVHCTFHLAICSTSEPIIPRCIFHFLTMCTLLLPRPAAFCSTLPLLFLC